MNKWIGCGRLTRDAEIRYTREGRPVAKFTLAVPNIFSKQEEDTDFIDCTAFDKKAEFIEKYCRKGIKLIVVGRLKSSSYTNKDGYKVYTKYIIIEELEFAESKAKQSNDTYYDSNSQVIPEPSPNDDGFMNIPDGIQEELPFR